MIQSHSRPELTHDEARSGIASRGKADPFSRGKSERPERVRCEVGSAIMPKCGRFRIEGTDPESSDGLHQQHITGT